jgi:predicted GNAT family acetyltransferase
MSAAPGQTHGLDNPVWDALTGRQSGIAMGGDRARRYLPDVSPFAAIADDSPQAFAELAGLVPPGGSVFVAWRRDRPFASTAGLTATPFEGVQMVASAVVPPPPSEEVVELGDEDAADMVALAALTRPGPFLARTHVMGSFIGIRKAGRLVAMAGERFKPAGFTEVSGVCTHPDWRNRGYAGLLSRLVASRIAVRGEIAMLHAFITNAPAIRLYQQLGFAIRTPIQGAVLTRN